MAIGGTAASLIGYLGKATKWGREIWAAPGAKINDIEHFTGSGANDEQQGSDIACSELLCMGHPDNAGRVWVRTGSEAATVNNAWPLDAGETFSFAAANLNELNMLIVVDGEKLIVAYAE